ncbi:hypothetical protein K435DRAFT_801941 [Dendrothele bispora CBS 962.96]|uniref:Uncharacterized protein n=1 Tax=Dendrothele bispora (strain CBS 962.96) TaxID=1314807 RepID=A0A4S8LNI2_DENBC|nr:hypothetical protein K435DRAFT_801941 [Dendrothele bispora CBS 962.96]
MKIPVPATRVGFFTGTGTGQLKSTHGVPVQFTRYVRDFCGYMRNISSSLPCAKYCLDHFSKAYTYRFLGLQWFSSHGNRGQIQKEQQIDRRASVKREVDYLIWVYCTIYRKCKNDNF